MLQFYLSSIIRVQSVSVIQYRVETLRKWLKGKRLDTRWVVLPPMYAGVQEFVDSECIGKV